MGIKETAEGIIEEAKTALDADGDGKVEISEVVDALTGRIDETVEAVAEAAEEIKKGFDADGDGAVSLDEVKAVAEAAGKKAVDAFEDLTGKATDEE